MHTSVCRAETPQKSFDLKRRSSCRTTAVPHGRKMRYAESRPPEAPMFPPFIDLTPLVEPPDLFWTAWSNLVDEECHRHAIWSSVFASALLPSADLTMSFQLAAVWALNMVAGSYCFPRYAAALAARAESD